MDGLKKIALKHYQNICSKIKYVIMKILICTLVLLPSLALSIESIPKSLEAATKEIDKGNFSKAIVILKKTLKNNPKADQSRFQLAVAYHLSKKNVEALKELNDIKTDPGVIKTVPLLKGNILIQDKKWKEALETWQKIPESNPDLKSLRSQGIAQAYEGLGKSSDAADAWTMYQSLQVKPMNDVFEKIAVNRIKGGEKEKALNYCASNFQSRKDYEAICEAYVFHANGEKKEAMAKVNNALEINKNNYDALMLGDELAGSNIEK
jgi:tetratricopeptide (TPR) repeat protein